ncbi:MAG: SixA phosphatase family protein [Gaiellales bacterium]
MSALEVLLVRHAIAAERDHARFPDDSLRPLTDRGRARFRAAARGLGSLVAVPTRLLASPYARTWETAGILAAEADWPTPERCDALAADRGAGEALAALAAVGGPGPVVLVGHEPTMTILTRLLVRAEDEGAVDWFRKGAAALVAFDGAPAVGTGSLAWQHQPSALRALAQ